MATIWQLLEALPAHFAGAARSEGQRTWAVLPWKEGLSYWKGVGIINAFAGCYAG